MKRTLLLTFAVLLLLPTLTVAAATSPAQLRIIHAVTDAPTVTVLVNGEARFDQLAFGESTAHLPLDEQIYNISLVSATAPNLTLFETAIGLRSGRAYTLIAAGTMDSLETLLLEDTSSPPAADEALVRLIHLSPTAPTFDLLAEGATTSTLFKEISFRGATNYTPLPAGGYELTLQPDSPISADETAQTFRTTLNGGQIYTILALSLSDLKIISHAAENETETETATATVATTEVATESEIETETDTAARASDTLPLNPNQPDTLPVERASAASETQPTAVEAEVAVIPEEAQPTMLPESPAVPEVADVDLTAIIAEAGQFIQPSAQLPLAEPAAMAVRQRSAIDQIDLPTEQRLIPAAAPDTIPDTGFSNIYGLALDEETPPATADDAQIVTTTSTVSLILGLLVLGGCVAIGFQAARGSEATQKPRRRRAKPVV